jgi:hypothetical protein
LLAHTGPAVAYSLDTLLPIVELEKSFQDVVLQGFAKYYFYFPKLMGWVLASFPDCGPRGHYQVTLADAGGTSDR